MQRPENMNPTEREKMTIRLFVGCIEIGDAQAEGHQIVIFIDYKACEIKIILL